MGNRFGGGLEGRFGFVQHSQLRADGRHAETFVEHGLRTGEAEDWWRNVVCWAALRGAYVPGGGGLANARWLVDMLLKRRGEVFAGNTLRKLVPELRLAFEREDCGDLLDGVREFFRERLESEKTGVERNAFGVALARLGDTRRGVGVREGLPGAGG